MEAFRLRAREDIMKAIQWTIAAAALAFVQPAQAGVNSPEVIIYRVSGVLNGAGTATSFHCTNFSGVEEIVRIVVRNFSGLLVANQSFNVGHLSTLSVSTTDVLIYNDFALNLGFVQQGTAAIAATSVNITCTAMQVQDNATVPLGIALHMTRFSPIPATQE
jgi:hypothetical protein